MVRIKVLNMVRIPKQEPKPYLALGKKSSKTTVPKRPSPFGPWALGPWVHRGRYMRRAGEPRQQQKTLQNSEHILFKFIWRLLANYELQINSSSDTEN